MSPIVLHAFEEARAIGRAERSFLMLDLLIRNGLVIAGSGNPGYYATVGVEGDEIRILQGDTSSIRAARTIDASGHVVSPGFIDMHSHGGLKILCSSHNPNRQRCMARCV